GVSGPGWRRGGRLGGRGAMSGARTSADSSKQATSQPARANAWAIPWPMVPSPTTATRLMPSVDFTASVITLTYLWLPAHLAPRCNRIDVADHLNDTRTLGFEIPLHSAA